MTDPGATGVEVCLGDGGNPVVVGSAAFANRGSRQTTSFTYARSYLALSSGYDIDPAMPRGRAAHVVAGLPGAFADLTPDSWGRNLIARAGEARPIDTDADFLLGVSDATRQGALRFRQPDGLFLDPDGSVPRIVTLPALLQSSDEVTAGDAESPAAQSAVERLLAAGSGTLGGARPKASVRDGDALYIAKFPHSRHDDWDVEAWEKTTLDLAEQAGIAVPARRLESVGGRHVLLVARFDRHTSGQRIGYVSASTLVGGDRSQSRDYLDLSAAMEDHSGAVDADLADMWRRMAFSVAVHNTDDHLRNHGFLHAPEGWRLSPAFDLNPNPNLSGPRSTSIYGEDLPSRELAGLRASAQYFGLSDAGAEAVLQEVVESTENWREVADSNGVPEHEIARFEECFEAIRHRS